MSQLDRVLVVDDDAAIAKVLCTLLKQHGLDPSWVASGDEAIALLERQPFDAVLSDIRMPGAVDGMQLLDHVRARYREIPVVLITAHGSVALAVDAMKRGAADFVQKPFDRDELAFVMDKALASSRTARSNVPPASEKKRAEWITTASPAMERVIATVRKVAPSATTVLIRGETGTGKELVATALHELSPRKDEPFIRVHCGALPETLLESELFGHEKGAFTGALARKPGRVELAHRGTLLLDEIGDISLAVQVKLLRVLQERELERVGGTQTIRVDVRVIAATHRDLEAMTRAGTFREDLFYRLNVVPIQVPPLRERSEDIPDLIAQFAGGTKLSSDAIALLAAQPWPGNVRQLENFIERLVVLADGPQIDRADVERELGGGTASAPSKVEPTSTSTSLDGARREREREALVQALARAKNNRSLAARLLEVSRRTLYNKIREHGIE